MSHLSQQSAKLAVAFVIALAASTAQASPNFGPKPNISVPKPVVVLAKPTITAPKPATPAPKPVTIATNQPKPTAVTKPAAPNAQPTTQSAASLTQEAAALTRSEHELITVNMLKQFEQIAAKLGITVQDAIVLNKEFGPGPGDPTKFVMKDLHKSPSSAAYCQNGVVANYGINPGVSPGGVVMNANGMISGPYSGPAGEIGGWVYTCA